VASTAQDSVMTDVAVAMRTPQEPAIEYPESDGQPMAETDVHRDEMTDVINMLAEERLRQEAATRQLLEERLHQEIEARVREAVARQATEQRLTNLETELAQLRAELTARTQAPNDRSDQSDRNNWTEGPA
jgi:hypothetical protein